MKLFRFLLYPLLIVLSSCGIFGIHIKVHNPRKAGKYPHFSKETILLGKLTPIRHNFNVNFYFLDININPAGKTLDGWVEIRAKALTDIDSVQLDLDHHLTIDDMHWGSRNGQNLNFSRLYRGVFVKLPEHLQKGQLFSIHVKYHGKPVVSGKPPWKGGMVWKKDPQNNDWDGVVCESDGASLWFPCKDVNYEEPDSARMRFTIPDTSLFVVSNGNLSGTEKTNNSRSFTWKVSYPINLYDITFYTGNFIKLTDSIQGIGGKELRLTYYVLKPNAARALHHFTQVRRILKTYEELYGEYPWYNDGFKLVESPYTGMEHQTAIAYGNSYRNTINNKDDYIILHETGHEWFGNAVTAGDLADVWLQEGITTYGEYLYLEKMYNESEAYRHLLMYRFYIKNKRPLVGPYERKYFDYHDGDVYTKGAWMLHTLRNNINNDSIFFLTLRTFYQENKYKVTNSGTFIGTVNKVTGNDYKWFFDQYLYRNKVPFLEYQFCPDGTLYYRWIDVSDDFDKLRVLLNFDYSDNTYVLYPETKIKKFKLPEGVFISRPKFNDSKALFGVRETKKLMNLYNIQEQTK